MCLLRKCEIFSSVYLCITDRGFGVVYFMSSLNDFADRFKKSLHRSQSGPEVKRKAVSATENLSEGKRTPSPGTTLPTEDRLLHLRKEVQSLGSDVHPNSLVRFLIRLLEVLILHVFLSDMPTSRYRECCSHFK